MKENEAILRQRIYLQRLPSDTDKIINQSIDRIEVLLKNPTLNKDRRASLISTCSKTITQYKFDLLTLNLDIMQNIANDYEILLGDLHKKLLESDASDFFRKAIENRRQVLIERHELYLQHKLNTFFDEAPTVSNE